MPRQCTEFIPLQVHLHACESSINPADTPIGTRENVGYVTTSLIQPREPLMRSALNQGTSRYRPTTLASTPLIHSSIVDSDRMLFQPKSVTFYFPVSSIISRLTPHGRSILVSSLGAYTRLSPDFAPLLHLSLSQCIQRWLGIIVCPQHDHLASSHGNKLKIMRHPLSPPRPRHRKRARQRPMTSPWQTSSALNSEPSSVR